MFPFSSKHMLGSVNIVSVKESHTSDSSRNWVKSLFIILSNVVAFAVETTVTLYANPNWSNPPYPEVK